MNSPCPFGLSYLFSLSCLFSCISRSSVISVCFTALIERQVDFGGGVRNIVERIIYGAF
jgi:hypothetical protein